MLLAIFDFLITNYNSTSSSMVAIEPKLPENGMQKYSD